MTPKWLLMIKNDVIVELFQSLLYRHQIGLETSIIGSDSMFDCVHVLYYKSSKINLKRSESCTDSPDWIKNKKTKINPINKKRDFNTLQQSH